jgi:hypothetical protein
MGAGKPVVFGSWGIHVAVYFTLPHLFLSESDWTLGISGIPIGIHRGLSGILINSEIPSKFLVNSKQFLTHSNQILIKFRAQLNLTMPTKFDCICKV